MARGFWKGDCDRFSAVELKDGKIEILFDGKPWGNIAAHDANFRFHRHKGLIVLEMLDEIEKYIDSDGEWPDWIGEKNLRVNSMLTLCKSSVMIGNEVQGG